MDRPARARLPRLSAARRRLLLGLACLALAACASRPGHYYQDDGPPDHPPAGLAQTPDAVPRVEPLNPRANRPYAALGRTYTPDTSDAPFEQRGIASWYGRQYHGNPTASGEPYDMYAMTAAHPTLPIPSYARVTRVSDGRSVVVRINDRGPFMQDRVIDLSYAAATRLGIVGPGSAEVSVRKITARDIAAGNTGAPPPLAAAPAPTPTPVPVAVPVPPAAALPTEAAISSRVVASADEPAPPDEPPAAAPAPATAPASVLPSVAGAASAPVPVPTLPLPPVVTPPAIATPIAATSPAAAAPSPAAPALPAMPAIPAIPSPPPAGTVSGSPGAVNAARVPMDSVAPAVPPVRDGSAPMPAPTAALEPSAVVAAPVPPAPPEAGTATNATPAPAAAPRPSVPAGAVAPATGKWSVQLGAFAVRANAEALRDEVAGALARPEAAALPAESRQPRIEFDGRLHHVLVGAFDARGAAQRSARALQRLLSRDTTLYQP